MKIRINKLIRALELGAMFKNTRSQVAVTIFMFLSICILPTGKDARAQDKIGIFFDENAGAKVFNTTELNQEVSAYVTILLPSHEEGIGAYEGRIEVVGASGWGVEAYGGCAIGWTPYPILLVACPNALVGINYVVVAEYIIYVESPGSYVELSFTSLDTTTPWPAPFYRPFGSLESVSLTLESGDFTLPVATINGSVANDVRAWGGIKALYR